LVLTQGVAQPTPWAEQFRAFSAWELDTAKAKRGTGQIIRKRVNGEGNGKASNRGRIKEKWDSTEAVPPGAEESQTLNCKPAKWLALPAACDFVVILDLRFGGYAFQGFYSEAARPTGAASNATLISLHLAGLRRSLATYLI
jgi:hypothetical protein